MYALIFDIPAKLNTEYVIYHSPRPQLYYIDIIYVGSSIGDLGVAESNG